MEEGAPGIDLVAVLNCLEQPKNLDDQVRIILDDLILMDSLLYSSCTENDVKLGKRIIQRLDARSKNTLWDPLKFKQPLNYLIISSHNKFVAHCLGEFGTELNSVSGYKASIKGLEVVDTLKDLVSNARLLRSELRNILLDVRNTDFNELREITRKETAERWLVFMQTISSMTGEKLLPGSPPAATEASTSNLLRHFLQQSCKPLLEGETGRLLSGSSSILSWCNLDSIDFNAFPTTLDKPNLVHLSVGYIVCENLEEFMRNKKFIGRLNNIINSSL